MFSRKQIQIYHKNLVVYPVIRYFVVYISHETYLITMKYLRFFPLFLLLTVCAASAKVPVGDSVIKAFCVDFNWSGRGYAGLALPEDYASAKPSDHIKWYKEHNVNTIQSFCVSHNGYAWYDSKIAPKVPGLESDFLTEMVDLGHKEGMLVMGYFSPACNVYWLENHPNEVYDNGTMFHMVYTKKYLEYLGDVIYEAVIHTGIDGFMIDAIFSAPMQEMAPVAWLDCEREMYEELFGTEFPGTCNVTPQMAEDFKRRATLRCWDTIVSAAKRANPECIVWLTCHELDHPQIRDNRIFQEVDWLQNESSDPVFLKTVRSKVGPAVKLIQCVVGWESHDASKLFDDSDPNTGFYGFAWPLLETTLPPTVEQAEDNVRFKNNARNIETMSEFYKNH